jgi:hypothetical protein
MTLNRALVSALLAAWLALPALAAPPKDKVDPHGGRSGAKAPPAQAKPAAAPLLLGSVFDSSDLKRIAVGNQAGLLKIVSRDKQKVLFLKDAPGTDMKGVDGVQWAPLSDLHRAAILGALSIGQAEVDRVAGAIIANFNSLPRREAIVLLGVLGSDDDGHLSPAMAEKIRRHLCGILAHEKDVGLRRQAVLALALMSTTDEASVRAVIGLMQQSKNAWETFTTQQYFRYHKDYINGLASASELKGLIQASGNPYASLILETLQGGAQPYAAGPAPQPGQPSGNDRVMAPGSSR